MGASSVRGESESEPSSDPRRLFLFDSARRCLASFRTCWRSAVDALRVYTDQRDNGM